MSELTLKERMVVLAHLDSGTLGTNDLSYSKLLTEALAEIERLERVQQQARAQAIEEAAGACMTVARETNYEWRACEGCAAVIRALPAEASERESIKRDADKG